MQPHEIEEVTNEDIANRKFTDEEKRTVIAAYGIEAQMRIVKGESPDDIVIWAMMRLDELKKLLQ